MSYVISEAVKSDIHGSADYMYQEKNIWSPATTLDLLKVQDKSR